MGQKCERKRELGTCECSLMHARLVHILPDYPAAPQPINTTLLPLTLKSHEKERARSEPIKQTQTSARRMHSLYTIPMGCGYLPGGCERDSMVNGSHDPRANDGLTIAKREVKPTKYGG